MSTSLLYHNCGIKGIKVHRTEYLKGSTIFHAEVKDRLLRCPHCQSRNVIRFGHKIRVIKLIPFGSKLTLLKLKTHRIKCKGCGNILWIKLPFLIGKSNCSRSFIRYMTGLCCLMTIKSAAGLLHVGWDLVKDHHKEYLKKRYRKRGWKRIRYIGIDEFSIKKGHAYMTIAVNLETGEIIYAKEGKSQESLIPLLLKLRRYSSGLQAIALDMNPAYIGAVLRFLPKVPMVFDHFHIVRMVNDEIDQLRREAQAQLDGIEGNVLKGIRYLLLSNYEDLDEYNQRRLQELFRINHPLITMYVMKEQLLLLWKLPDRERGEKFLTAWAKDAMNSGVNRLIKLAKTLLAHRTGILNYFDHRITTGKVEGINNKIKTLKRQVYGFRDMAYFKLRLYHLHMQNYSLSG